MCVCVTGRERNRESGFIDMCVIVCVRETGRERNRESGDMSIMRGVRPSRSACMYVYVREKESVGEYNK